MQDLGLGELPVQVGSQPDASQGPGLGEEGRFVKHGGWQEDAVALRDVEYACVEVVKACSMQW